MDLLGLGFRVGFRWRDRSGAANSRHLGGRGHRKTIKSEQPCLIIVMVLVKSKNLQINFNVILQSIKVLR